MQLISLIQRRWKWLLPLLAFAPAAMLSSILFEIYFRHFELPALAAAQSVGVVASSCHDHKSEMPERAPKDCELARKTRGAGGEVRETFYFSDGSQFTLESRDGQWRSSGASCTALERQSWLSGAGMLLLIIATFARSIRTGQYFHFPGMKRHPLNDFESIVGIYGACLFAGSFVGMAVAKCSAMGVRM